MNQQDKEQIARLQDEFGLTLKQARFAWLFNGNGTEAARLAGYTGTSRTLGVQANRMLKTAKIVQAIRSKTDGQTALILSPQQILIEWSRIAQDQSNSIQERQRALESLARSHAMFTDKQLNLNLNKTDRIDQLTDQELEQLLHSTIGALISLRPDLVSLPAPNGEVIDLGSQDEG